VAGRGQDVHVLDILVQRRRDKKAAEKFFRKLLKGLTYVPQVIITYRLKSYKAAMWEILPSTVRGGATLPNLTGDYGFRAYPSRPDC
jgi:transposase-like protein